MSLTLFWHFAQFVCFTKAQYSCTGSILSMTHDQSVSMITWSIFVNLNLQAAQKIVWLPVYGTPPSFSDVRRNLLMCWQFFILILFRNEPETLCLLGAHITNNNNLEWIPAGTDKRSLSADHMHGDNDAIEYGHTLCLSVVWTTFINALSEKSL